MTLKYVGFGRSGADDRCLRVFYIVCVWQRDRHVVVR